MKDKLLESFNGLLDSAAAAAPKVVMGILLFLVALVVAKIVEKVLKAILTRVRFDTLVQKAGIDKTLHRMGLRRELNEFVPRMVYFLLLFLLAKILADVLGAGIERDRAGAVDADMHRRRVGDRGVAAAIPHAPQPNAATKRTVGA